MPIPGPLSVLRFRPAGAGPWTTIQQAEEHGGLASVNYANPEEVRRRAEQGGVVGNTRRGIFPNPGIGWVADETAAHVAGTGFFYGVGRKYEVEYYPEGIVSTKPVIRCSGTLRLQAGYAPNGRIVTASIQGETYSSGAVA